jgi:hypothetical protein
MGTVVATVHDSILVECASHQFDRLKHHKHHWIEEGTDDDFKWCILNSDLPYAMFAMFGSGSTGAPMWRSFQGVPDREEPVPLMGTYVTNPAYQPPMWRALQGVPDREEGVFVQTNFASVERRVIEMLMNRPEVVNHEPKAKAPIAATR